MTNLKGNILLFLKIRSGSVDEAASDLRDRPEVTEVNRLLGQWDLVVSGNFPDYDTYRAFAENIETKPYCDRVSAYPCFREWRREKPSKTPITGWAMIGTNKTEETFEKLKDYQQVYWMTYTTGDYNIIALMGARELDELSNFMTSEVQRIPGVKRTETLPSPQA
ncbi:MAG: Lrp/AsnC ligand binding domain-containing protein [Thermoplasmata archaeon]